MKYIVLLLLLLTSYSNFAQCNYNLIHVDEQKNLFRLESRPIVLDIYETAYNGRLIEAKLIRNKNQYTIEISITQDSYAQELKQICFQRGSKLSFSFTNNKTVTLTQLEDEICGIRRKGTNNYNTVTNYARFILTKDAYDILIREEIVIMKIISKDYTRQFVLKSELEVVNNEEVTLTHPNRFFMENIKCLKNPGFNTN